MTASAGKLGQHWCFKLGALLAPRGPRRVNPCATPRLPYVTHLVCWSAVLVWMQWSSIFSHRCMHACRIVQPLELTLPWGWGVKRLNGGASPGTHCSWGANSACLPVLLAPQPSHS